MKILGNAYEPEQQHGFLNLFPDHQCLEEFGFSRLHKAILQLERADLDEEIQRSTKKQVNAIDAKGRTPPLMGFSA